MLFLLKTDLKFCRSLWDNTVIRVAESQKVLGHLMKDPLLPGPVVLRTHSLLRTDGCPMSSQRVGGL